MDELVSHVTFTSFLPFTRLQGNTSKFYYTPSANDIWADEVSFGHIIYYITLWIGSLCSRSIWSAVAITKTFYARHVRPLKLLLASYRYIYYGGAIIKSSFAISSIYVLMHNELFMAHCFYLLFQHSTIRWGARDFYDRHSGEKDKDNICFQCVNLPLAVKIFPFLTFLHHLICTHHAQRFFTI